jgi:hypothetical protein
VPCCAACLPLVARPLLHPPSFSHAADQVKPSQTFLPLRNWHKQGKPVLQTPPPHAVDQVKPMSIPVTSQTALATYTYLRAMLRSMSATRGKSPAANTSSTRLNAPDSSAASRSVAQPAWSAQGSWEQSNAAAHQHTGLCELTAVLLIAETPGQNRFKAGQQTWLRSVEAALLIGLAVEHAPCAVCCKSAVECGCLPPCWCEQYAAQPALLQMLYRGSAIQLLRNHSAQRSAWLALQGNFVMPGKQGYTRPKKTWLYTTIGIKHSCGCTRWYR